MDFCLGRAGFTQYGQYFQGMFFFKMLGKAGQNLSHAKLKCRVDKGETVMNDYLRGSF